MATAAERAAARGQGGMSFGAGAGGPAATQPAAPKTPQDRMLDLFERLLVNPESGRGGGQGNGLLDLIRATRGVRRDSSGFELAPTKAEQVTNDNAAWAAMFPKITDPAIRASQGMTAENQWAALGADPARGGVAMTPEQTGIFSGLVTKGTQATARAATDASRFGVPSRIIPDPPTVSAPVPTPFLNAGQRTIAGAYGSGTVGAPPKPKPAPIPFDQAGWETKNPELAQNIRNDVYSERGLTDLIKPTKKQKTARR